MIETAQDVKSYKQKIRTALENKFLRTTLDNFGSAYKVSRAKAFEGFDFEAIRHNISSAKESALPQLAELLETFKANAEKAGVTVHFAEDAEEANNIIAKIAKDNSVKNIVKSKSMTAEETFLNDHLESRLQSNRNRFGRMDYPIAP